MARISLEEQYDNKDVVQQIYCLKDRMKTAEDDIDSLEGRMDTAESDIDSLEDRMDTAESDIDSLETRMDTAESDIDSLESRMDTAESDIDSLEIRMDTAESDIDSLEGRMDTAESDIDSLETRMDTAESDIDDLQSRMTTAEGDIDSLEGRMDTAESDIDSLETRMTTAEGDIDSLEDRMDTAESDIDDLQSRMTTAEGDIDSLETRMDTAEGNITQAQSDIDTAESDIDSLESRMDSVEAGEGIIKTVVNTYESSQLITAVNGVSSDPVTIEGTAYELPIASADTLGGVRIGEGISIDGEGVISATGEATGIESVVNTVTGDQLVTSVNGVASAAVTLPAADLSEIESRLDAAESDIDALESEVDGKADTSAVSAIGVVTSGNTVTVNGSSASIVSGVSGSVDGSGNLRITVNGVESGDIPLGELSTVGYDLTVNVTSTDGTSVSGVTVRASDGEHIYTGVTDSAGIAHIIITQNGDYTVSAPDAAQSTQTEKDVEVSGSVSISIGSASAITGAISLDFHTYHGTATLDRGDAATEDVAVITGLSSNTGPVTVQNNTGTAIAVTATVAEERPATVQGVRFLYADDGHPTIEDHADPDITISGTLANYMVTAVMDVMKFSYDGSEDTHSMSFYESCRLILDHTPNTGAVSVRYESAIHESGLNSSYDSEQLLMCAAADSPLIITSISEYSGGPTD